MEITKFSPENKPTKEHAQAVIQFLFEQLEAYGDPKPDIEKAVAYALKEWESFGGFVLVGYEKEEIVGAVVVNKTGMKDYIPENILVYIATHKNRRGKGLGKQLMQKALDTAEGGVALHVEPENPARKLYEGLGFTSKYLEMRYFKA